MSYFKNFLQKASKTIFIIAVVFFVTYTGVYLVQKEDNIGYGKTDFAVFYVAGAAISGTLDIKPSQLYDEKAVKPIIKEIRENKGAFRYLYFPQAAFFFTPFSFVPYEYSFRYWAVINSILFVVTYYLSIYLFDKNFIKIRYSLLLFALSFADSMFLLFKTGQINGIIWFLFIASAYFLHKKKNTLAALCMSIAATIKVFPIIFLGLEFVKKQWKVFISTLAFMFAFFAISVPIFGIAAYKNFFKNVLLKLLSEGNVGQAIMNTSLYGSFMYSMDKHFIFAGSIHKELIIEIVKYGHLALVAIVFVGIMILYSKKKSTTQLQVLIDYMILILFFLLFSRGIHSQYHIWVLPIIVYLIHFDFKKRFLPGMGVGLVTLLLTQFWGLIPHEEEFVFFFLRPGTIGLVILFIVAILLRLEVPKKYLVSEKERTLQ